MGNLLAACFGAPPNYLMLSPSVMHLRFLGGGGGSGGGLLPKVTSPSIIRIPGLTLNPLILELLT